MKLAEVREILKAEVLCGHERLSEEVNTACGADLMSDVLASKDDKSLLLTGLTNVQVVRTAEVLGDIVCIVFVRGKEPGREILEMADAASIVVMKTDYPLFIACGKIKKNGLNCGSDF